MQTSYHVHTLASDGIASMDEMIQAAISAGLDEVGISDHYVALSQNDYPTWSMPLQMLDQYISALRSAQERFSGRIIVRIGLEVDYLPDQQDLLKQRIAEAELDYTIGSIHYLDGFPIDEDAQFWERISTDKRDEIIGEYWHGVQMMAKSGLFTIAGHLDLYKKFGHLPCKNVTGLIEDALDAIAASDMIVEFNTSGWFKPAAEAYPSPAILEMCRDRDIPILVTADAHSPEHIFRAFDRAKELLKSIGCRRIDTWFTERLGLDGCR